MMALRARSDAKPLRLLVVDDSALVRTFIRGAFGGCSDIEIVALAKNGREGVDLVDDSIDVVILDVEMPVLNGLDALPLILKAADPPPKVLMASALTRQNAAVSLQALAQGAADYIPKPSALDTNSRREFQHQLVERVRAWGKVRRRELAPTPTRPPAVTKSVKAVEPTPRQPCTQSRPRPTAPRPEPAGRPAALAVGCSTGGPQALSRFFRLLKGQQLGPIFVTQHMPATFTALFAEQLARAAGRTCIEAQDSTTAIADTIYLAPGDYHLLVEGNASQPRLVLSQSDKVNFCRPAVDPMFESLAKVYGRSLYCVVLTGMGHDGLDGARRVIAAGGQVHVQDETSSVVWGMPGAIAQAGIAHSVEPIETLAEQVRRAFGARA